MKHWLYKRGKVWHYRFVVAGVEHLGTTRCTDRATALQVVERVRQTVILDGSGIKKAPSLLTLAQTWLETRGKNVSKAHKRAAEQSLTSLEQLHALPLTHLTSGIVEGWRAEYRENHSEASANLVLRYLKLWMRWAMTNHYIREMPYTVKMPRPQERPRPVVPLDEIDAFLAKCAGAINPQIVVAIRAAMMLGLRESELLGMRWEWIRGNTCTVSGKTKSKKIRAIPIPAVLMAALLQLVDVNGPVQLPNLGLVFPAEDGKPHRQGWLRQALKRGGKAGLGMHRLRATFATLHLRAGTPLKEVQEMLGHADPRTTLIYQETSQTEKTKAQDALWKQA